MNTSSWTSFRSGLHGFHFQNDFSGRKYKLPGGGSFSLAGLCGGMCFAALDYAYQRKPIPAIKETPLEGPLFDHLLSCQLRTLNVGLPGDKVLQKTFEWMNSPNVPHHPFSPHSLRYKTRQEWPVIKSFLDSRHPITLMLIRARGFELTNNHQVLAFGYRVESSENERVRLFVYDPNYPDASHEVRFNLKGKYLSPWQSTHAKLRGVFPVPYDRTRTSIGCEFVSTVLGSTLL